MALQSSKAGSCGSTSSSNSRCPFEYDVFLSFRGVDTRDNFTGFLHERLKQQGVRAFLDEEDLHKGDRIDGIWEAISRSQIYVPIFSERYAESTWCLKEVAKMVKCCDQERRIMPVFFDVNPTDVKHQSGPFEAAFKKHEKDKRVQRDEVDEWKRALEYVGKISGFHLKNGNQRELIKSITAEIHKNLPTKRLLDEGQYIVGLESRLEEMMKRLEFQAEDVRIIGIHGIGGLGKTTVAKAVYNRSHRFFEASSFIENVREKSECKGLVHVQKQLIQDISKDTYKRSLNNESEGTEAIMQMVGNRSVLLVLDDVDDRKRFNALAGNISMFHSRSRIIITTRHEAIFKLLPGLQEKYIYRLGELDEKESLQLFNYHAFEGDETQKKYRKWCKEIVSISNGLPLVLEAFGSLFKTAETPKEWENLLNDLKRSQPEKVHEKLRICYDSLKNDEKLIFLDIACLLLGKNKEDAIYMWEADNLSPTRAIRSLQNKSLIKIKKGKFEMHDQIRKMGREIVQREDILHPEKRSRLWREGDIVHALTKSLTKSREENKVQGIILREGSETKSSTEAFKFMSELRILHINFAIFDEYDLRHLPASLKWLEWKNCPVEMLPLDGMFKSIVILNLSGSFISKLWSETTAGSSSISSKTMFPGLKVLDLSCCGCLNATPNFWMTPNLKRLIFDECSKLKQVDDSIESLKKLVFLSMRRCVALERLPNKIFELSSLEVFNLEGCSNLADFPQFSPTNSSNGLSKLEELILRDCESLKSLPDLDKFESLRSLHIDGCQCLDHRREHLFEDVEFREEWDELSFSGSQTLLSNWKLEFSFMLPIGSINDPLLLQQLQCFGDGDPCENGTMKLCVRHEDITNGMVALEIIHEIHCGYSLPIGHCYTVNFGSNDKINEASRSKTIIVKVTASNSSELTKVVAKLQKGSKFSSESMKAYINIWKPESLASFNPSFNPQPEFSMYFNASEEDKLDVNIIKYSTGLDERIANMMRCKDRIANMISCKERTLHFGWTIEELIILTLISGDINVAWYKQCSGTQLPPKVFDKMKVLDLSDCKFLVKTHDFSRTPHLEKLILDHCECLVEIGESIGQLKSLILLRIVGCAKIYSLPCSIGSLENLQELILDDCTSLTRIPNDVGELKRIRRLSLKGCRSLQQLPNSIGSLKNLQELILDDCTSLTIIPYCVGELKSLRRLSLKNCRSLQQLSDSFKSLKNLQELIVDDCTSLTIIPYGVGELKSLHRLSLKNCRSLQRLPDSIKSLVVLEELNFSGCQRLTQILCLENLRSLKVLHIDGCLDLLPYSIRLMQETAFPNLEAFSISSERVRLAELSISSDDLKAFGISSKRCLDLEALSISCESKGNGADTIPLPFPKGGCKSSEPLLVQKINVQAFNVEGISEEGRINLEISVPRYVDDEITVRQRWSVGRDIVGTREMLDRSHMVYEINKRLWLSAPRISVQSADALAVENHNFTASFGEDDEINKCLRRLAASSDATPAGTLYISCSPSFRLERVHIWFLRSPTPVPASHKDCAGAGLRPNCCQIF